MRERNRCRSLSNVNDCVVTVAKFQGGGAFNVIPDSVTIGGTFRAFSKQSFFQVKQRIQEVIAAQASVQRCTATVDFMTEERPFFPAMVNSKDLYDKFQKVAGEMLGLENVRDRAPLMGAEDFAFFSEAENISKLVKAANVKVDSYWPGLFMKLFEKRDMMDLVFNVGSGGGATPASVAAPDSASGVMQVVLSMLPLPSKKRRKNSMKRAMGRYSLCSGRMMCDRLLCSEAVVLLLFAASY